MQKSLACALLLAYAWAEEADAAADLADLSQVAKAAVAAVTGAAGSCCPSACPTQQSQLCCQNCPKLCLTPPDQGGMPIMKALDDECNKTQMTWSGSPSCAPLKATELQCLGNDGEWYAMPNVSKSATALTVSNQLWHQAPFNLPADSKLYCQVRSSSKWGWGYWSSSNDAYKLPNCNPVVPVVEPAAEENLDDELEMPCACNRSCQVFGCNGCCKGNQGAASSSFWNKVSNKACCASGACKCGKPEPVPALSASAAKHEHKYCHVDRSPRFVKKTKWVAKTVKGKTTVLVPKTRKVIDTIMVKKIQHVPDVVYGPQEVITRKRVMEPVVNKISKPIKKTRQVQRAITNYRDEAYKTYETQSKKTTKKVKRVRMVPKIVETSEIEWTEDIQTLQKTRYVKKPQMQAQLIDSIRGCDCYKSSCDCQGQPGCGCCFPTCSCAPDTTKQRFETVSVMTQATIEEPYTETKTQRVPKVVTRKRTIQVPEEYWADETVEEPTVREVVKTRKVPEISYVPATEDYIDYEITEVKGMREVEKEVKELVNVPRSVMTSVEIEEPKEVMRMITEQIAVVKPITLKVKVPITIVERLPDPPCHWHTIVHSHEVLAGQTHSHSEDHDHA